jgi:hypothetical protein
MPYIPYTRETPLTMNALTLTEGFDVNDTVSQVATIKTNYGLFEAGRTQAILNSNDISSRLEKNENLQKNSKYKKYIPTNGKTRPSAADEIIRDSALLNDANNQVYILGSIAVASLVVLSFYM